ncbi:CPBP family intramembrane glutamic endopeptidase [Polymorphospora rubra]|uniref:CAAX prenyl protease 2/Lysostaphin resistance protein A-like domain-containing protein n=1 Tax=Polymorphospora rubra TaxID=338584 RepID=A0A810MY29_9ACTN|nr:CPBP family intramembrane glutamic endopeptidase [Polymorphospora rubra]BCJ65394.1 hypothetical protein Prubr_24150 [Polymorphospora rubra]
MGTVGQLVEYSVRLTPGIAVIVLAIALLGRAAPALRIALLIVGFILVRDLMTPLGFWTFGRTDIGLPWLRFIDDGVLLLVFGAVVLGLVAVMLRTQPDLAAYVVWGRLDPRALATAVGAAAVIAVPLLGLLQFVPLHERGGAVAVSLLVPLLVLALLGNFMEEVIFRGFLQGYLEQATELTPGRVIVLSGLIFAAGHAFLAITVTDLGWPILAFTFAEGLACAWVKRRSGVLAASLTHGLIIFTLASGL